MAAGNRLSPSPYRRWCAAVDAKRGSGKGEKKRMEGISIKSTKTLLLAQAAPRHRSLELGIQGGTATGSPCSCPLRGMTQEQVRPLICLEIATLIFCVRTYSIISVEDECLQYRSNVESALNMPRWRGSTRIQPVGKDIHKNYQVIQTTWLFLRHDRTSPTGMCKVVSGTTWVQASQIRTFSLTVWEKEGHSCF